MKEHDLEKIPNNTGFELYRMLVPPENPSGYLYFTHNAMAYAPFAKPLFTDVKTAPSYPINDESTEEVLIDMAYFKKKFAFHGEEE